MNDLHPLQAIPKPGHTLEAVDPRFVRAGLLRARERSWHALREIRARLRAGMTEAEGRDLALATLQELGAVKHWHKPYLRFGPGTTLTFYDTLQPDYRLQDGDAVHMDLGPVWSDPESPLEYEGDVGDTFAFGENPEVEACVQATHRLWREARDKWQAENLSGQALYVFLKARATELGYQLIDRVTGHRLGDYPHIRHAKERLSTVAFPPTESLWILEFQLLHPERKFGAFYEDLLQ